MLTICHSFHYLFFTVYSKQFWAYIKSQRNDQTSILALQTDGKVVDDDYSEAESFNCSVFTKEGESPLPQLPDKY